MIHFFIDYGLFVIKIFTLAIMILFILSKIISSISSGKIKSKEHIEIINLNEKYQATKILMNNKILEKQKIKKINKCIVKEEKTISKNKKSRIFVLDVNGDIQASFIENLREEITAILMVATTLDEVVVKIESAGGLLPNYGLAASQLQRIRDNNITLTVIVDKVAASGGYMMACVANHIFAAPFAVIGSIGVIAQLPNFNKLLKKHDIDFEQVTAGKYKRTVSLFGENTSEGRNKFQDEINEAHRLFKNFIVSYRPSIDIDSLATGEIWYGIQAKEKDLVDKIITSDDYLLQASDKNHIFKISYRSNKRFIDKFKMVLSNALFQFMYQ